MSESQPVKPKPAKTFRAGALSVSVWEKRSKQDGSLFYNATPQRCYKDDKADEWKYTDSLNRDDLPIVAALLHQAFSWVVAQEAKAKEQAGT